MMNTDYIETIKKRRSIYALGKNVETPYEEVASLIKAAIRESPTAFNNQTVRAVILFNEHSDQLWEIVAEALKQEVPDEAAYAKTRAKIDSFKAGIGTILLFTDEDVVQQYQNDYALYADNFANWAEQAIGNAQINIWQALATNDIGASNQHYNPLINEAVQKTFDLPASWTLRAQMPFGSIEAPAGEKDYLADEDRFKVLK